jgi:hypothetical protein
MGAKRFSEDFERRAANARRPVLSSDLWAPGAADMVRILVFAGFDPRELIVRCLKRMRGERVSLQLVEGVITEMNEPYRTGKYTGASKTVKTRARAGQV